MQQANHFGAYAPPERLKCTGNRNKKDSIFLKRVDFQAAIIFL